MNAAPPASLRAAQGRIPLHRLRVLEPACGPATYLAHFGAGSLGIDRSAEVCERARAVLREVDRAETTVAQLDLDQRGWSAGLLNRQRFEAAFLCDVVMHVREPAAMLTEMASLLEPGAPVLSVEWTLPRGTFSARLALHLPGAKDVFETPEHHRTYHADELVELFERSGYEVEDTWLHSFEGRVWAAPLRRAVARFWPARTRLLRARW